MAIQDLKSWHWIAAGAVVGVVLVGIHLSTRQTAAFAGARTIDPQRFVKSLDSVVGPDELPMLRDIVVHPPRPAAAGDAPGVTARQCVTGQRLQPTHDGHYAYMPFVLFAPIPFTFSRRMPPPSPDYSVRDLLEQRSRDQGRSIARFAWWETTPMIIALWGFGSVIAIGGIWPLVLNFLVGAGFGRRSDSQVSEYDLSRFSSEPSEPNPSASMDSLTDEDRERLRQLESQIQSSLGDFKADAPAAPASGTSEVPTLNTQIPDPIEPAESIEHHYEGEYYPVERHPVHEPGDAGASQESDHRHSSE